MRTQRLLTHALKALVRSIAELRRSNRGSALVELAVGLPLLLLLVIGVADYARVYYTGITVANAARIGAHYGVAYDDLPDSMVLGAQRDAGNVTLDTIQAVKVCRCPATGVVDCVTVTDCPGYGTVQVYDSVRVREDVPLLIPYPGLPTNIPVIRTAILRAQ